MALSNDIKPFTVGAVLAHKSKLTQSTPAKKRKHYINPPKVCDLCGGKIGTVLYDFSIPPTYRWGNTCHGCFQANNGKLGTGLGQKYRVAEDGKYYKVEG